MPYASVDDLTARFDSRLIAEYASDRGIEVSPAALSSARRVTTALSDASAIVDSACQYGKRYTRDVLAILASSTDPQSSGLLKKIVCTLAMVQLIGGRVAGTDAIAELVKDEQWAVGMLDSLRNGESVFDIEDNLAATLPYNSEPDKTDLNRPTYWNPLLARWPRYT